MKTHAPLQDLLDERLGQESAQAAKVHLKECSACLAEWQGLLSMRSAFKSLTEPSKKISLSPQFEARFWAQARRRQERPSLWRGLWRPWMAAAGLATLIIGLRAPLWQHLHRAETRETNMVSFSMDLMNQEAEMSRAETSTKELLDSIF